MAHAVMVDAMQVLSPAHYTTATGNHIIHIQQRSMNYFFLYL